MILIWCKDTALTGQTVTSLHIFLHEIYSYHFFFYFWRNDVYRCIITFKNGEVVKQDITNHNGATHALLDGEVIGLIGKVHPTVQKALDLQDTFVFELDVEPLLAANLQEAVIQSVAKYPSMTRDIAILAPTSLTHAELVDVIRTNAGEFLSKVTLFDVYKGEHVPEGFQSLAYSLLFVNRNATLEEDVIKSTMTRVEEAFVALDNVSIR